MSTEPTPDQFQRLAASEDQEPVFMLNLLRFKAQADGIDAADGISGADAYARYGAGVTPFLDGLGGRVVLAADARESVIGPDQGEWDLLLVVEYPRAAPFWL